jgi:hypothetical protein
MLMLTHTAHCLCSVHWFDAVCANNVDLLPFWFLLVELPFSNRPKLNKKIVEDSPVYCETFADISTMYSFDDSARPI